MATIENGASHQALAAQLRMMSETELVAQQLTQQGAIHMLTFLLTNGCTEKLAIEMLVSLRLCMEQITAVAEEKGYAPLFSAVPPTFN